jgi:hypothetical protein
MTLGNMRVMMRPALILLSAASAVIGSGYFQVADAQCAVDNKTVFIDPRLIPPSSTFTPQSLANICANEFGDRSLCQWAREQYMKTQVGPIEIPYAGGRVLINPQNRCIQQFIPN